MKLKNVVLGIKSQMPLRRLLTNFFVTGNAWGMFHKRSHYREDGKAKQSFPTLESAKKAAESMGKKYNKHFSTYKCIFCDGYHLGKNRDNK